MKENNRKVVDLLAGTSSSPLLDSKTYLSKPKRNIFIGT